MPSPSSPPPKPPPGALLQAVNNGNISAVRRLLKEGAEIEETDSAGNTPLCRALFYGPDMVRILLENNPTPNLDHPNKAGNTPLMILISSYASEREPIARQLLAKGASLDIKNNNGETARSIAASNIRHTQILGLLNNTAATRKRLAEEFARAAAAKRREEIAKKQDFLKALARKSSRPEPKPPKAA